VTRGAEQVQLQHLLTLAAIGRDGSFGRAADTLGYTQSAVSQQIRRLETAVGHVLVERSGGSRRTRLTPAGELLVGHAEAIRARLTSASADLAALSEGSAGVLRVGCYQSVGVRVLPRLLGAFRARWPHVRVELTEAEDDGELLREVERGELDLSFVVYPMPPGPFGHVELMEDPYVVAVRSDDPLAAGTGPVRLAELAGVPLVTYAHMRAVHAIENRLGRPELAEQVIFRSNDNGTILGLAAEGVGVAVVSWLSVDPHRAGVRVRPLAAVPPRIVGIAWHRDRYRIAAADTFVRTAQQESLREHRTAAAQLSG
jgi:molybdate transport repressor ModE-like protein